MIARKKLGRRNACVRAAMLALCFPLLLNALPASAKQSRDEVVLQEFIEYFQVGGRSSKSSVHVENCTITSFFSRTKRGVDGQVLDRTRTATHIDLAYFDEFEVEHRGAVFKIRFKRSKPAPHEALLVSLGVIETFEDAEAVFRRHFGRMSAFLYTAGNKTTADIKNIARYASLYFTGGREAEAKALKLLRQYRRRCAHRRSVG